MKPSREEVESLIHARAAVHQLNAQLLIRQCDVESRFDQDAVSPVGAIGLFQLMPATSAWLHVDAHDWRANVEGGIALMRILLHEFGPYDQALAAYNWGSGNMRRLLAEHGTDWRAHLPTETAGYLKKVLCSPTK
jgi:soluble lytic murein transglycosylase-like protein